MKVPAACPVCLERGHSGYDCPERDGTCDLCGQPYRSYVGHLTQCDGGD
jgi:hypothetical protein